MYNDLIFDILFNVYNLHDSHSKNNTKLLIFQKNIEKEIIFTKKTIFGFL